MRGVKKILAFLSCAIIVGFGAGAYAGDEALFVSKCGACHKKGGEAPPVNPADKAGSVWVKYFKRHRHPTDLSASISPDELKKIIEFLKDHAADSEQPAAAVIPE